MPVKTTDPSLAERCARARGWEIRDSYLGDKAWFNEDGQQEWWVDIGDNRKDAWRPLTDANQRDMLWEKMIEDGWELTMSVRRHDTSAKQHDVSIRRTMIVIHPDKRHLPFSLCEKDTGTLVCLAFLRAKEGK